MELSIIKVIFSRKLRTQERVRGREIENERERTMERREMGMGENCFVLSRCGIRKVFFRLSYEALSMNLCVHDAADESYYYYYYYYVSQYI